MFDTVIFEQAKALIANHEITFFLCLLAASAYPLDMRFELAINLLNIEIYRSAFILLQLSSDR